MLRAPALGQSACSGGGGPCPNIYLEAQAGAGVVIDGTGGFTPTAPFVVAGNPITIFVLMDAVGANAIPDVGAYAVAPTVVEQLGFVGDIDAPGTEADCEVDTANVNWVFAGNPTENGSCNDANLAGSAVDFSLKNVSPADGTGIYLYEVMLQTEVGDVGGVDIDYPAVPTLNVLLDATATTIIDITTDPGQFIPMNLTVGPGECGTCPWDTDGDGDVDAADLAQELSCWGTPHGGRALCDCLDNDNDGDIDAANLAALLSHWGEDADGNGIPDPCE